MIFTQMTRKSTVSRMGRSAALALMLLSTSVMTGMTTHAFAQADENAVSGGEMTIIAGSDIKSWDPAITSGTFPGGPMDQLDAVYGFLVYVDLEGKVQGGMAESLTSDDATVWTLKLRPDVKFTDGNPYDAEAVVFNWKRAADPETLAPAQPFVSSWIDGVEIIDPLTIQITLPVANRNFGSTLAQSAPFVGSPAALEAAGADKAAIKPVGAGVLSPFPKTKIILDHLGKADFLGGAPFTEAEPLLRLARYPNLYVKVTTGNLSKAREANVSAGMFEKLVSAFGASRIAWGSNFPASKGSLADLVALAKEGVSSLSSEDQEWILGKTALELYPSLKGV